MIKRMFKSLGISSLIVIVLFGISSCLNPENEKSDNERPENEEPENLLAITINQGIVGRVWYWEGDFQCCPASGTITPVIRRILAHELTHQDSVDQQGYGAFFTNIRTDLIMEVISNDSGFFQLPLSIGRYSIFVVEDTLPYANRWGLGGYIMPYEVFSDSVTQIDFNIDYNASF